MCFLGFHDWERVKAEDVELNNGKEVLAVIEKCSECGKEKGYTESSTGVIRDYAPWYIRKAIGLPYKESK